MNLVIFLVRRRYVAHRDEQMCHDCIAPQLGGWDAAAVGTLIQNNSGPPVKLAGRPLAA